MLAAGVLAAATVLATAGAASAGPTAAHRTTCSGGILSSLFVQQASVKYFLGVPNIVRFGSTVRLKPRSNGSTTWCFTDITSGPFTGQTIITTLNGGGLALTTRTTAPGGDVTVETSQGFASQRWIVNDIGTNGVTLRNIKTGLFLRVRNSGPVMNQLVTTGNMATIWTVGIA